MRIKELINGIKGIRLKGKSDVEICGISNIHADIKKGYLFAGLKGFKRDGLEFVDKAIENGASAILCRKLPENFDSNISYLISENERFDLSALSDRFYDSPSKKIRVFGITGTNGKTTSSTFLKELLDPMGGCGLIGTISYYDGKREIAADRTTPEAPLLCQIMKDMANNGLNFAAIEVSSHSISLSRVSHVTFEGAAFTNLTRDHLDYHKNMEDYFETKASLFDSLSGSGFAAICIDDPYGKRLAERLKGKRVITFGLGEESDILIHEINGSLSGTSFKIRFQGKEYKVNSGTIGVCNIKNICTAIALAVGGGISIEDILPEIPNLRGVRGRFERVYAGQDFLVVIDYAHSDDALKNLLEAMREIKEKRIITIFGCGGDRDTTKRPLMGAVAMRYSDVVFITSDNPRSENQLAIAKSIESGVKSELKEGKEFFLILSRAEAIRKAINMARRGDIVVIAGKGHETYQIFKDRTIHFDDREEVLSALSLMVVKNDKPD